MMVAMDKDAVDHLWSIVQVLLAAGSLLLFTAAGLWRGFVWMKQQVREIAEQMLAPLAKDVVKTQAATKKAHKRISRLREDLQLPPDHYDEYETSP